MFYKNRKIRRQFPLFAGLFGFVVVLLWCCCCWFTGPVGVAAHFRVQSSGVCGAIYVSGRHCGLLLIANICPPSKNLTPCLFSTIIN